MLVRRSRPLFVIGFWLGLTIGPAVAETPPPTFADVRYGPHEQNTLDFWQADTQQPAPLVVFIHGGAGDKSQVRSQRVVDRYLVKKIHFVSINFRTYKQAPVQESLRDCARAIQILRVKADEWKINPPRIACYGTSAGAGASLWLAFHDDLADPAASDPIARQSSRVVAAGSGVGQFSYDILQYEDVLGRAAMRFYPPSTWPPFYGLKTAGDLQSPEGKRIRGDVDIRGLITSDDPPVYLTSSFPDGDPTDKGHANHHPRHMLAIKKRCDEVGVPAVLVLPKVKPNPSTAPDERSMADFLLHHLRAD